MRTTVLVTGAGRGIGRLAAEELAARGHRVLITTRDRADGERACAEILAEVDGARVESYHLDLTSFTSVRTLAATLARDHAVDMVLHNAGTLVPPPTRTLTEDGIEDTLQVHAVAPYLLSSLLLPTMPRPSRLLFVGSSLHTPTSRGAAVRFDADDPFLQWDYLPERAYKNAKLAQLWLALEWERRHGPSGVHADVVSPGFVPETAAASASGMTRLLLRYVLPRSKVATSPADAARVEADWAERDAAAPGGLYFDGDQVTEPSPDALDEQRAEEFWEMLEHWAPLR